jgi:DNA (cytosine-5)-methyltransferase 1
LASLPPIDAFAYGFPCNDFSVVGERRGFNGTFGPLYSYGVKVISLHNPLFFLAENVGGLTSAHGGNALKAILGDLESAGTFGYGLTTHYYRAEDYGVPQTRHRLIIVGIRRDLGKRFCVPRPTTKDSPVTVYTALQGIPDNAPNNEHTRQSQKVVERLMATKPGENAWTANLPDHLKLNVKTTRLSQIYKRLDPNKPAYTITGSGGGGTHCYHWEEPRALTNRERARIQTFPDDFVFEGSKESVRKQIGMAVPPLLAKVIFEAALKTLLAIPYDSVRASHEEISSLPFTPDCAPADGGCHECCRSH